MLETSNLALTLGNFEKKIQLVPGLNDLTLNWTFTYSQTISAPGLVCMCSWDHPPDIEIAPKGVFQLNFGIPLLGTKEISFRLGVGFSRDSN